MLSRKKQGYFSPYVFFNIISSKLISFILLLNILLLNTAWAQVSPTDVINFDIASQPLHLALDEFSRQANLQVSADTKILSDHVSYVINGNYSINHALIILLQGTGLKGSLANSSTVVIQANTISQAMVLPSLMISGTSNTVSVSDAPYSKAGSASVITDSEITRFRGSSVGDMFKGTTGVLVAENRNSGGLDINIRGMQGQGRVPVLLDGARQETTVYRGYSGVASRTYIDPDLIANIDIDKGPVMSAGGSGATGGLVSMRTINADDIITTEKDWGLRLRGSAIGNSSSAPPPTTVSGIINLGLYRTNCATLSICDGQYELPDSFGLSEGMDRPSTFDFKSWAGSIAFAKRFESLDVVVAYAQRDQGNYYSGSNGPAPELTTQTRELPFYTEVIVGRTGASRFRAEERIVNSNNKNNTFLLKTKLYLPDDQTWQLSYQRYDSEYGELMPSQLIWFGNVEQTENSEVTASTYTSRYHWDPINTDLIDIRFNLWHTHTNSINRNYSRTVLQGFSSDQISPPETYDRFGGDLSNEMNFTQWGEHQLSYGLTFQLEDMDSEIPEGQEDPLYNSGYGRIGERSEFGLFFNWQWQATPEVTINSGVRYSKVKTDDHKLVVPQGTEECFYDDEGTCVDTIYVESFYCVDEDDNGECDPIRYRTNNSGWAPIVSVSWEPWLNGVQFYARHAEGLRMPSLFETTQGWSVKPALDVPLKPEHSTTDEIGLNILQRDVLFDEDRLALKLATFRSVTDDYLTRTSPNLWEDGSQIFVMRNIDLVTLYGTELSLEYDTGVFYSKIGGTKYQHIEVCHYGSYRREECNDYGVANSYFNNMVPPEWHANAGIGVRLFERRLDLGIRGTFMGQRTPTPSFNDDTDNGLIKVVPWHKYTLVDIYASWQHNDNINVDFIIDNLTDQYYLDALSLGLVPAPGRTARINLTLNF